jgi:hypothetical protein
MAASIISKAFIDIFSNISFNPMVQVRSNYYMVIFQYIFPDYFRELCSKIVASLILLNLYRFIKNELFSLQRIIKVPLRIVLRQIDICISMLNAIVFAISKNVLLTNITLLGSYDYSH